MERTGFVRQSWATGRDCPVVPGRARRQAVITERSTPVRLSLGLLVAVGLMAAAAAAPGPALGQPARLNVGYSSLSAEQYPAWLAHDAGLFERYGLRVQLIFFEGGTRVVQAIVAGDVPIGQVAGPAVIHSHIAGSGVVMLAAGSPTLPYWLMASKEITRPEQLRGKRVAISLFGSSSDFITRFVLRKLGLDPERDVAIIQVGSLPARLAAMEARSVHATVLNPPVSFRAQKQGYTILADLVKMGIVYANIAPAAARAYIQRHPEVIKAYLRAHIEAIARLKADRELGLRVLARYMRIADREVMERTYEMFATEAMFPRKQYPPPEGVRVILDGLAPRVPGAREARPEQFIESRFIKELEDEGFIDRVAPPGRPTEPAR